jgi:formylmethanofuran dehydrogenase subunit B
VRELAELLLAGRYVAIVADAEDEGESVGRAATLIAAAQALNATTRCVLSLLRGGGNRSGADACLTWQTGYPAAVDFARGYPRYRPHDGRAAARLAAGQVDAVLVAGAAAAIPPEALSAFGRVPAVLIGPRATVAALAGIAVAVDTGVAGIHERGTALRMDEVPLPLRALVTGPPDAAAVMRALRERLPRSAQ